MFFPCARLHASRYYPLPFAVLQPVLMSTGHTPMYTSAVSTLVRAQWRMAPQKSAVSPPVITVCFCVPIYRLGWICRRSEFGPFFCCYHSLFGPFLSFLYHLWCWGEEVISGVSVVVLIVIQKLFCLADLLIPCEYSQYRCERLCSHHTLNVWLRFAFLFSEHHEYLNVTVIEQCDSLSICYIKHIHWSTWRITDGLIERKP